MYIAAAELHLIDGNLEKANARMRQAVQLCRDQKLDANAQYVLVVAARVMKKTDPANSAKFLKAQLNHPNASEAYKREVRKSLGDYQEGQGAIVSSIQSAKTTLDDVQKNSPGSVDEAMALKSYGEKCLNGNLFDLGIEPLKRAKALGEKLNHSYIPDMAVWSLGRRIDVSG